MDAPKKKLTEKGKQEVALALYLWKDFKTQGRVDHNTSSFVIQAYELAEILGVKEELDDLYGKMPPFHRIFKPLD